MIINFKIVSGIGLGSANEYHGVRSRPSSDVNEGTYQTYDQIVFGIDLANKGKLNKAEKAILFRAMKEYVVANGGPAVCTVFTFAWLYLSDRADATFLSNKQFDELPGLAKAYKERDLEHTTKNKHNGDLPRDYVGQFGRTTKHEYLDTPKEPIDILDVINIRRKERRPDIPDKYVIGFMYNERSSCITGTNVQLYGHAIGMQKLKDGSYEIFDTSCSYEPISCSSEVEAKEKLAERADYLLSKWREDADRQKQGLGKKLRFEEMDLDISWYPPLKSRFGRTTSWARKRFSIMPRAIYTNDIRCWWDYGHGIQPSCIILFPIRVPKTIIHVMKRPDGFTGKWNFP
ncbi:hypothetical protein ACFL96_05640 [Thermoproteota archaeon]